MRPHSLSHALFLALLLLLTACGGGGGGADPDPGEPDPPLPGNDLGLFKALMLGTGETTVLDADARASAFVQLADDGALEFVCAGEAAWIADVVGMHIHRGAAGLDGPVVVDLLGGGASFDPGTLLAADTLSIDAALAEEIAATPEEFYVNVHTSAAPAGLARAQLGAFGGAEFHAALEGDNEVPPADPGHHGGFALQVGADLQADWVLAFAGLSPADVQSAHVHAAPTGVNGPVVVDLGAAAATLGTDTLSGVATVPVEVLALLCVTPQAFYANAHTAASPGGAVRGQLDDGVVELWTPLRGDQETVVVDGSATGGCTLELLSLTTGRAMLAVHPDIGISAVTGAHVHEADPGVDGPVVIDLTSGSDYVTNPASFSSEGSIAFDPTLFARILANPAGFYANAHTAAAPAGLVRGQLGREPVSFFAALAGDEETIIVDPSAAGALSVVMTGVGGCTYGLEMSLPPIVEVTAAHVHNAEAGLDGPVLIDLLGGGGSVSGDRIDGEAAFTGRTFARLMAAPEQFYGNAHTGAAPDGIARGQFSLLSGDTPPAGLVYATPVSYVTGTSIAANAPSSVGGAISAYGVSPALPAGLVLDPVSGVLSGTPTTATAAADYTVTGSNAAGSTDAVVNITVTVAAPAGLSYATPVTYTVGTAISANSPSSTGGAIASYSVSPALPGGLGLDTGTGVISGTPTTAVAAADYTVTGTNATGSTTATVNITVTAALSAPSGLSYSTPVTYTTGTAITPNTPTIGGGAVSTWGVAPALPAGLSLNAGTGVISGTPTAITGAANYTVTASNAAGSTTSVVNITVNLGAPTALSYTNDPNIAYVATAISAMTPSSSGGTVASYSVSPALPSGLGLNTTTGVISGTPTATMASTNYTVTATNAAGSTTATITIIVY